VVVVVEAAAVVAVVEAVPVARPPNVQMAPRASTTSARAQEVTKLWLLVFASQVRLKDVNG